MAQQLKQIQQLAELGFTLLGKGPLDTSRPVVTGGHVDAFNDIVALSSPRFVVEVGSWQGRSAVLWGNALAQASGDWALACIDTWLGSVEQRQIRGGDWGIERLYLEDHYPSVFRTFASNIRRAGMADNVIPLPIDSSQGLEILAVSKICADIIYVDAAHDYAAARADIALALTLRDETNANALVLCDDFDPAFPGVQQAVRECAAASAARLVFRDGQAALLWQRADAIADALVARGWMEEKISAARKRSASTGEERDVIQRLTADLRVEQQRANAALTDLYALRSSFSWRITAPLRAIRGALRRR
jgi:predicted O-methyltransferase YrrM